MDKLCTLGDRIRSARKAKGWSQSALASMCGWDSASRVGNYEQGTREPSLDDIRMMTSKLGVSMTWLTEGTEPRSPKVTSESIPSYANTPPGSSSRARVPVISSVRAGDYNEVVDNFHPGDADEWIEVSCQVMQHTFALIVEGDSMEPEFTEGMRVVVEPDMEPQVGDYVVAGNGDRATLKKLVRDGDELYLKPLNSHYPTKPLGDGRIIGVVREAHRKYR